MLLISSRDLMVFKSANKLYRRSLLLSLLIVFLFFFISVVFNHSLVNSNHDILPEGIRVDPTAFVNKGYSLNSINKTLKETTPLIKETLNESDKFNINGALYYNFFFLTFKWISFSSLFVLTANQTFFHNILFKRIRLINGNKKIYSMIPFIYSLVIFIICFFFAFSLYFLLIFTYDEFFDYTELSISNIFIPIAINILFSTFLYVFLAIICIKKKTLITNAIIFNFMIPFVTTILSLSSKDGYLYYLIFSGFDPSSILIAMVRDGWRAGYELAPQQRVDGVAVEVYKLWRKVVDKNVTSFKNWWLIFPLFWSLIYASLSIKLIFFKREKYA